MTEYPDRVAVGIVVGYSLYPGFGDPGGTTVVRLKAPLGGRPVYDASNGARLVQNGPAPGASPCPTIAREEFTPLDELAAEREQYGMNVDPAFPQSLLAGHHGTRRRSRSGGRCTTARSRERPVRVTTSGRSRPTGLGRDDASSRATRNRRICWCEFLRHFAFHVRAVHKLAEVPVRFERSTVQREWFYTLPLYIGDDARANDGYLEDFVTSRRRRRRGHADGRVGYDDPPAAEAEAYFKGRYGGIVACT